MAGTNDFQTFAAGGGANVIDQADYLADTTLRANGFSAGVAESDVLNKVWRQSSFIAAAIAQLVANNDEDANDNGDLSEMVLKLTNAITAIASAVPAVASGSVLWFAANTPPAGYLECNGAVVSRTTYASLFAIVGTTFNTGGEPGTDFRLPDLRGYFIRGWDHGRGIDPARTFGSNQADAFASHSHVYTNPQVGSAGTDNGPGSTQANSTANGGTTGATGSTETRPKNVALLPCIKT